MREISLSSKTTELMPTRQQPLKGPLVRIPLDEVTATTPCPGVFSPRTKHYPRTVSGRPVTMPYLANGPLGQHQIVMPSLCSSEHLLPPRSDEAESAGQVCGECLDQRAAHCSKNARRLTDARAPR